jgi:hypothetical protein
MTAIDWRNVLAVTGLARICYRLENEHGPSCAGLGRKEIRGERSRRIGDQRNKADSFKLSVLEKSRFLDAVLLPEQIQCNILRSHFSVRVSLSTSLR